MKIQLVVVASLSLVATACNLGGTLEVGGNGGPGNNGWPAVEDDDKVDPVTDPVDEDELDDVVEQKEIDVARVTLHRLNRAEYNNTVRDLLGDTTRPADNFPDDDFGYGFNNIADVLSLSPLHLELYQSTAEALVDAALAGGPVTSQTQRFEAETVGSTVGAAGADHWNLYSTGEIATVVTFESDGDYTFRVRARQSQAGPDDAMMSVTLNGQPLETFTVTPETMTTFEVSAEVNAGAHQVGVTFENDFYDPAAGADRNLYVDWFEVEGPTGVAAAPETGARASIMTCTPADSSEAECASQILSQFARRAWRRPVEQDELTRLVAFVDLAKSEGDDFETGIRLALQAILVSPNFIFRVELDPDPNSDEPHPLTQYELASRLSYFLWSSMPDDELLDLAEAGQLADEATLRQQVTRMLDDPKSAALIDNFATQWLFIDVIRDHEPDYAEFPTFDDELRASMRTETRMFIAELFETNADIRDLLLARFSFIDARLAQHYEVPAPANDGFQRVTFQGDGRRGLLSHGGLLTSLSFPTRTSPVKRGAWVLGNLLCAEPPAPPPGVENLPTSTTEGKTLREQMEAHATDPSCSSCHRLMDPIGFGMENYDGIGAWRDQDNGAPVDSSGKLPDGTEFNGAAELADIIADMESYPSCVTEKTLTYALGRGVHYWDEPQIDLILERLGESFGFRDLISEIVVSPAFRMRRGGELQETTEAE